MTDELWFARLTSHSVSGREDRFRNGVRARDGKCVISGQVNRGAQWDDWAGFEAAHVFPLEKESLWIQFNYGRWLTNMDDAVGVSGIHSIQNGLLMAGSLHTRFDQYLFSINPDISVFRAETYYYAMLKKQRIGTRLLNLDLAAGELMEEYWILFAAT